MILIKTTSYTSNLDSFTTNRQSISINGMSFVYADITNTAGLISALQTVDSTLYLIGDGVLLPPVAVEK